MFSSDRESPTTSAAVRSGALGRDEHSLKEDVAFLRAMAEGGATASVREGAILATIGVIFGLVALQYWALDAGLLGTVSGAVRTWLWLDGFVVFIAAMALISRRFPNRAPGAASRALAAAWGGVGASLIVADVGLVAASRALALPQLATWMFPLILFVLIGAAWSVAYAVRRRRSFVLSAAGSFAAAVLCGALMGRPEEWLVLSGGLLLLLAVPGAAIVRAARRQS
jgi:hypothetical protein